MTPDFRRCRLDPSLGEVEGANRSRAPSCRIFILLSGFEVRLASAHAACSWITRESELERDERYEHLLFGEHCPFSGHTDRRSPKPPPAAHAAPVTKAVARSPAARQRA